MTVLVSALAGGLALVAWAAPLSTAGNAQLCNGMVPTITGTDGDNDLHGTDRFDVILAKAGDDTVHGADGSDTICGNNGNDKIFGQAGIDDVMFGGSGKDTISGKENVPIVGDSSYDTMHGGPGADTLNGPEGGAQMWGGDGPDVLKGDSNGVGGGVQFQICGEAGDDDLSGGAEQADKLSGGSGHDTGNAGEAILTGHQTDHCHSIEEEHGCEVSDANEGCFG